MVIAAREADDARKSVANGAFSQRSEGPRQGRGERSMRPLGELKVALCTPAAATCSLDRTVALAILRSIADGDVEEVAIEVC